MRTLTRIAAAAPPARATAPLTSLWQADARLTTVGVLMLLAAGAALIGLVVDPRVIAGAPAWLKPFKFGASTAIYAFTLAWIFGYLSDWPRARRVVGWTTAVVLTLEVAIISLQAWRGTTSHFNMATPLDSALFTVMGAAILLQTFISIAIVVALWRQRFDDRPLGWALRAGMTLTVVGALTGALMTRPTPVQIAGAIETGRMLTAGAHTVGGPDGGGGLPVTGWSRDHGDLRVPHFVGLHAVQALAIVALGLGRWRRRERDRIRATLTAVASYASLFMILLWQALRGESLAAPGGATTVALAIWAASTLLAVGWIAGRSGGGGARPGLG